MAATAQRHCCPRSTRDPRSPGCPAAAACWAPRTRVASSISPSHYQAWPRHRRPVCSSMTGTFKIDRHASICRRIGIDEQAIPRCLLQSASWHTAIGKSSWPGPTTSRPPSVVNSARDVQEPGNTRRCRLTFSGKRHHVLGGRCESQGSAGASRIIAQTDHVAVGWI